MKKIFLLILIAIGIWFGYQYYLGNVSNPVAITAKKVVKTRFAVLSDTHSDSANTRAALQEVKTAGIKYIIDCGDLTTIGTDQEFSAALADFNSANIAYRTVPGDHDLWKVQGSSLYQNYFGSPYYSFDKDGVHFIAMDTSDTTLGIDSAQITWLKNDLNSNHGKPTVVYMHLPIYHPTSDRTIWEKGGNNLTVKAQADQVLSLFKDSDIIVVFAGDHHLSSEYTEPTTGVKMYVDGAVTSVRNLQKPRYDVVTVYTDNSVQVDEKVIGE